MLKQTMIHAGCWASVNVPWSSDGLLSGGCRPGAMGVGWGEDSAIPPGGGRGELQHHEMDST